MMKRSLVLSLAAAAILVWANATAQAASLSVDVMGATELNPGETTDVVLILSLAEGEEASTFQGVFRAAGTTGSTLSGSNSDGSVNTDLRFLGGDAGNTWPNTAANRVDDNTAIALSQTSNNRGETREMIFLTLTAGSPGLVELLIDAEGFILQKDVPPPVLSEDIPVDNVGMALASITVIPEPGTVFLLGLGLASLAAYGRRRQAE